MNWKKFVSIFTTACFLMSFVPGQALFSAMGTGISQAVPKLLVEEPIVGQSVGRVTDSFIALASPSHSKTIVNIQDLHCNSEVQRNIAGILEELDRKYGLHKVYIEGAYGDVSTAWLCNIKEKTARNMMLEGLMDEGRLTGSEYFSVKSGRPSLLKGLENRQAHEANIVRLNKILAKKEYFGKKLEVLEKDLQVMGAKYLNLRNKRFNVIIDRYRNGSMTAEKFYRLLRNYVTKINRSSEEYNNISNIKLSEYPNISIFLDLSEEGRKLNYVEISKELAALVREIKMTVPYGIYKDLMEKTANFTKLDELSACLAPISKDYKFNLAGRCPSLLSFLKYTEKKKSLNPIRLIDEQRRLVEEIRVAFSNNVNELEISFLADFFSSFKDYLLNSISPEDLTYFWQYFGKFKSVWAKYAFKDRLTELGFDFKLLDDFYNTNLKRNEYFINNIPELSGIHESSASGAATTSDVAGQLKNSELIVVVAGGFHTEGIRNIAREKGVSYIAITPNIIKGTKQSSLVYAQLAREQATILEENAQFSRNSMGLAVASQLKSDAIARLMVETAKRKLSALPFTKGRFEEVVKAINEALGDGVESSSYEEGVIKLKNDRTINIKLNDAADAAGKIESITITGEFREAAEAGFEVLKNMLESMKVPDAYSALKSIYLFAEKNDWANGYGLIKGIDDLLKSDPDFSQEIDGIPVEVVANLPEDAQTMILNHIDGLKKLKNQPDMVKKVITLVLLDLTGLIPAQDISVNTDDSMKKSAEEKDRKGPGTRDYTLKHYRKVHNKFVEAKIKLFPGEAKTLKKELLPEDWLVKAKVIEDMAAGADMTVEEFLTSYEQEIRDGRTFQFNYYLLTRQTTEKTFEDYKECKRCYDLKLKCITGFSHFDENPGIVKNIYKIVDKHKPIENIYQAELKKHSRLDETTGMGIYYIYEAGAKALRWLRKNSEQISTGIDSLITEIKTYFDNVSPSETEVGDKFVSLMNLALEDAFFPSEIDEILEIVVREIHHAWNIIHPEKAATEDNDGSAAVAARKIMSVNTGDSFTRIDKIEKNEQKKIETELENDALGLREDLKAQIENKEVKHLGKIDKEDVSYIKDLIKQFKDEECDHIVIVHDSSSGLAEAILHILRKTSDWNKKSNKQGIPQVHFISKDDEVAADRMVKSGAVKGKIGIVNVTGGENASPISALKSAFASVNKKNEVAIFFDGKTLDENEIALMSAGIFDEDALDKIYSGAKDAYEKWALNEEGIDEILKVCRGTGALCQERAEYFCL